MLKRDNYSKFTKEEFNLLLRRVKSEGFSHQEAFDKVKEFCSGVVKPNFKSINSKPKTREEFIERFLQDIKSSNNTKMKNKKRRF